VPLVVWVTDPPQSDSHRLVAVHPCEGTATGHRVDIIVRTGSCFFSNSPVSHGSLLPQCVHRRLRAALPLFCPIGARVGPIPAMAAAEHSAAFRNPRWCSEAYLAYNDCLLLLLLLPTPPPPPPLAPLLSPLRSEAVASEGRVLSTEDRHYTACRT
jgi:hypothetical protein